MIVNVNGGRLYLVHMPRGFLELLKDLSILVIKYLISQRSCKTLAMATLSSPCMQMTNDTCFPLSQSFFHSVAGSGNKYFRQNKYFSEYLPKSYVIKLFPKNAPFVSHVVRQKFRRSRIFSQAIFANMRK